MNSMQTFEEWWASTPILGENKRTIAEKAWQASRESLVIELPQASYSGVDTGGWPNDYGENRRNSAIDECRKSIRAAGIRTK